MSVKMSKENICINQIVGQKDESFIVEGDEIVPDIKPDVLNIISSNGIACVYKKEIQDGKVKVDGCVYIYTIYVADDETSSIKCINSCLDFSKFIDIANINSNMQLESLVEVKSISCKILNGRKINLQANLRVKTRVYSNETIEAINDILDIDDVQRLDKTYAINSLLGGGTTKVYAKDTVQISSEDDLSDIAKVKLGISNRETKVSYNKVLVKADADIRIMYVTEDNRIGTVDTKIPVMGFIDIQDVNENNLCEVNYELKNIVIKPNSIEDHSIYIEAELEISCNVYENREINMIQDLYSPSCNLEYSQKNISIMQNKREIRQTCNIRKQENINEIGKNRIVDVEVNPVIISSQIAEGRVSYEGEVNLTFLFEDSDGHRINSKMIVEPFSFNVADGNVDSRTKIDTSINVTMQDFIVMPDESIDIKIDLEFNLVVSNTENINVINDIEKTEDRNYERSSVVIYYTKAGDTLWNIAKRFGSTIDNIVRVNNVENVETVAPGEQLFIPRVR